MAERHVHRSMQGKEVNMAELAARNETMPSVGNVRMNARGDLLGPGGTIVQPRSDVVNGQYNQQSKPTK